MKDPDNSVVAWVRRGGTPGDEVVVIANWTPVVREDYWLRAVGDGWYGEVVNTDAAAYGGSNVGNLGGVAAQLGADGVWYLRLRLPPLGVLLLKRSPRVPG